MVFIYNISKLIALFCIISGVFIFSILSIVIFARKFGCEKEVLNGKLFSFLGKRKNFKYPVEPTTTDGALVYTLSLIFLIYIGSIIQAKYQMSGLVMTEIGIALIPILYSIYIKVNFKDTFRLKLPKIKHIIGAIFIWIGAYFLIYIVTQILLSLFPENKQVIDAINTSITMDSFWLNLLTVAVLPAVCEEMLFRGFILSSLEGKSKKSKVFAVVMTGILFGIMHLNFIRIIPISILGIAMTYCVIKSDSILVGMLIHFINNGLSVAVLHLVKQNPAIISSSVEMSMPSISSVFITLVFAAIFIFMGVLCYRKSSKKRVY